MNPKPTKEETAFLKELKRSGKLHIRYNVPLYELHEDVAEAAECAFTVGLEDALDILEYYAAQGFNELENFRSFSYRQKQSMTINGRKCTWYEGRKQLIEMGIIKFYPMSTIYSVDGECWYRDHRIVLQYFTKGGGK